MNSLQIFCEGIEVPMETGVDIVDITSHLSGLLEESGIKNGLLSACVTGSTGSLTTIEYESGVVEDLKRVINELAPSDAYYAHEEAWRDGNGHSHVQAALLGPSISLPVRRGRLSLGTWQQVVMINHDNCSRKRAVEVTIVGLP